MQQRPGGPISRWSNPASTGFPLLFTALGDETRLRLLVRLGTGRERIWELESKRFDATYQVLERISRQRDDELGRSEAFVER